MQSVQPVLQQRSLTSQQCRAGDVSIILLFRLFVYFNDTQCLLVLHFPFFVLAYRKVLVVCEETLVSSLLDMSARETAMMAVAGYVDLHWVEFPMKC